MTQADLLDKVSFIMCLLHYAHVPNTTKNDKKCYLQYIAYKWH